MCDLLLPVNWAVAQRAGVALPVAIYVIAAVHQHAARQTERGAVSSFDAEGCAILGGIAVAQVDAVLAAMKIKGLIVDERLVGMAPRALTSTERSQRRRARLRGMATACNDATLHAVAPVAPSAKSLIEAETCNAEATPSRARQKKGSENTNNLNNLPDLKDLQEGKLHSTRKHVRAVKAERWLSTTMEYAGTVLSPGVISRMWGALGKLEPGQARPFWLQRDLDRLDAQRRGLQSAALPEAAEPVPQASSLQREFLYPINGGPLLPHDLLPNSAAA